MTAEAVCATCPHGESEHQDIESRDEPPQPCCLACANALIDDPWDDTVRGFKPYHPFKLAETDADAPSQSTEARCHAGQDGDCIWSECPQNRDGEPQKSGRSCPIYAWHLDEEGQPWPVAAARPEPPVEGALEEAFGAYDEAVSAALAKPLGHPAWDVIEPAQHALIAAAQAEAPRVEELEAALDVIGDYLWRYISERPRSERARAINAAVAEVAEVLGDRFAQAPSAEEGGE